MTSDQLDHWGKRSLDAMLPHFQEAQKIVKISSGFFTISGFNLIQSALEGTVTFILVGYDDTQNANLIGKLLADIEADLMRWGPINRREAVTRLVAKLQRQEVYFRENDDEPYADARIRKNDHGKVYIIDDRVVILGSVNLTRKGLLENHESSGVVNKPDRVQEWVKLFDEKWNDPDTVDLTQLLLRQLLDWLDLVPPFHVYLKSIQVLIPSDEPEPPRKDYKLPAEYQQVIIKRALRQLKTYRGAMIVASTGMGKTVMATDICYQLCREGIIDTVLVFAPTATHPNWEDDLDSAGINHKIFTQQVISQDTTGTKGKHLNRVLGRLDNRHIIILDESHFFRNEYKSGGKQKFSFKRLIERIESSGCFVLLLTATPYAKGVEDINNQLKLLPHNGPAQTHDATGQGLLMPEMTRYPHAWMISEQNFFEVFRQLEIVTLISTSWVAKNFGNPTPNGDFVRRPDGVVWIPHLNLRKINVPLPFERQMKELVGKGYFKHQYKRIPMRDGSVIQTNMLIETQVTDDWSSSPLALKETLFGVLGDRYEVTFIKSQEDRSDLIEPIYTALEAMEYDDDPKLKALIACINEHLGEKIIIFTERKPTAVYLEQAIQKLAPDRAVATPILRVKHLEYTSLDDDKVQEMIENFAPISNHVENPSEDIDIIILTDAHSTGINLQDANVVISYDLAWTADVIIQRAGRIMRFWNQPRQVYIYAFVGVFEYDDSILNYDTISVSRKLKSLVARSRDAEEITEVPVLPADERQRVTSLGEFNRVTLEDIGELAARDIEEYSGGSPFLAHITALINNQPIASNLGDDINSAKVYGGKDEIIYLLLRYADEYVWLVFNATLNRAENWTNDRLLAEVACDDSEPVAVIDKERLEEIAQSIRQSWCEKNNVESHEVERICAMYLKPKYLEDDLGSFVSFESN